MKYLLLFTLFIQILSSTCFAQSLWDDKAANMFIDTKTLGVSDSITVLISESSSAIQKAATQLDNETDISLGPGTGMLKFDDNTAGSTFGESDSFDGSGSTERSGSLRGTITVRITQVMGNGYYKISGTKEIFINAEKQKIKVSGIIRPEDIDENNTVMSSKIRDAKIKFDGSGPVGDSQEPGILSKVFGFLF